MKKTFLALLSLAASSPVYALTLVSLHGSVSMAPTLSRAGITVTTIGVIILAGAVAWRIARRKAQ